MSIDQVQAITFLLKQFDLVFDCKQVNYPSLITHYDNSFLSLVSAFGLVVRCFELWRLHRNNLDRQRYSHPWFELAHIDLHQLSLLGICLLLSAAATKPRDLLLVGQVPL